MKKQEELGYPENLYFATFGKEVFQKIPADALESVEHALKTLRQEEADILMLRYKDELTYVEIGKKYGLTSERVRQKISRTLRRLRHPSRSRFLLYGLEGQLIADIKKSEEKGRLYKEHLAELEERLKTQNDQNLESFKKIVHLTILTKPLDELIDLPIEDLYFSIRVFNAIKRAGINTIRELLDFDDLYKIQNLGKCGIQEISEKLRLFVFSPRVYRIDAVI